MSAGQIAAAVVVAALLFWAVGAYNRLVRLRGTILRRFAPLESQFRQRNELLLHDDALAALAAHADATQIDALRAACGQVETACDAARLRPGVASVIKNLRLADEILMQVRARLPAPPAAATEPTEPDTRLGASDATLAFARREFNEAVGDYNVAVRQFPTLMLVGLFGFRSAGLL
ncbi:MAG: LemA family protein [Burkholderiaceae bacterium]